MIQHINSHTGLRGFLALSVTALHLNIDLIFPAFSDKNLSSWFNGALCVDLFFVLSGFVLCVIYEEKLTPKTARDYLVARVARIFPLHTACLIAVFVMYLVGSKLGVNIGSDYNKADFVTQLLLIHEWYPISVHQWIKTSWSVSFEWLAYVVCFPLFVFLSRRFKFERISSTALIVWATIMMMVCFSTYIAHYEFSSSRMTGITGLFRSFGGFLSGCFIAKAFSRGYIKLSTKWDDAFFLLLIVACILKEVASPYALGLAYLIIPIWVLHLAYDRKSYVVGLFSSKIMMFLGAISYSLYLIHPIIGKVFYGAYSKLPEINSLILVILLFTATIFISYLSYRIVEMPARSFLRKRLSSK